MDFHKNRASTRASFAVQGSINTQFSHNQISSPEISPISSVGSAHSEKPIARHIEQAPVASPGLPTKEYWENQADFTASGEPPVITQFADVEKLRSRPPWTRRCADHLRRRWYWYALAVVVFLIIMLPILFLVIFPAIVQSVVNKADLPVESASLIQPTPDGVIMSMVASIKVPAGFTIKMDSFNLSMFTQDSGPDHPYGKLLLPSQSLKGSSNLTVASQDLSILNLTSFESFLGSSVNSNNFSLNIHGQTTAHIGALKANIKLDKAIHMQGLDKLSGFGFSNASIVFPPDADDTNIVATVNLPNHSPVTFELGNLTFNLLVGSTKIGLGFLNGVTLSPGNNSRLIRGVISVPTIIENLESIIEAQADALRAGNLAIVSTGNSTIVNGQRIPYYEAVLNSLQLEGEMPILPLLTNSVETFLTGNSTLLNDILAALKSSGILSDLLGGGSTGSLARLLANI